ncbi:sedoheptulose 7-phosphate cyclase [Bradyrhizobium sp. CCGUVB4N]|uniref:sedoheptulose 7-phosphate cyclase n=1 Tax=Bradyrhizobium sp. CCGUVB4N TaxID=2949631 RepID=UPI0020B39C7F|nr:sedoheptulose 7-phosphate cyclase [Bradyrhizobium sp. CCGUVB4N]MCP3380616.1 sedoheptulose 7-phosphate cyclase [Bradyrhizobium sp. CCGUVB4N]
MKPSPAVSPIEHPDVAAPALELSLEASRCCRFGVDLFEDVTSASFTRWIKTHLNDHRILVVMTPTVYRLYSQQLSACWSVLDVEPRVFVLACTETTKSIDAVMAVCRQAQEADIDRRGVLVSIGGGVCSDIVGLAASLLRRGISHVRIPTTLIGQVDAGIGLKGGVNFGVLKSYIGCFYPPKAVAVIPTFLRTLSEDGILQGIAEIVKLACVCDSALFEDVEATVTDLTRTRFQEPEAVAKSVLRRSISGMLTQLSANPFETATLERAVDFGHTLSHPLEAATGYQLHHGFAVAIDIAFSAILASRLSLMTEREALRIVHLLTNAGLPIYHAKLDESLVEGAFDATKKHRDGALNLVVPTGIGRHTFVKDTNCLSMSLIGETIEYLQKASHTTARAPVDDAIRNQHENARSELRL